jgi:hypothetical protein
MSDSPDPHRNSENNDSVNAQSPSRVDNQEEAKDSVVTEHHRNTITVQSTKVVGEFNYSFVSVSPT